MSQLVLSRKKNGGVQFGHPVRLDCEDLGSVDWLCPEWTAYGGFCTKSGIEIGPDLDNRPVAIDQAQERAREKC